MREAQNGSGGFLFGGCFFTAGLKPSFGCPFRWFAMGSGEWAYKKQQKKRISSENSEKSNEVWRRSHDRGRECVPNGLLLVQRSELPFLLSLVFQCGELAVRFPGFAGTRSICTRRKSSGQRVIATNAT